MSTPAPREPGVQYDIEVKRIDIRNKDGRKEYERWLAQGWEVELVQTRWNGATYTFRRDVKERPKKFDDPLARWAKKKLKAIDEKMMADNERFKQERLEKKAARAEEKAAKKAAKEQQKGD